MPHIQHALINHWLRDGKEVRSAAAGRIGQVVSVLDDGEWVKIKFGSKRSTSHGVTKFNSGDDVYWREEHDVKSGKTSIIITNSDPTIQILPPEPAENATIRVTFNVVGHLVKYDPKFHDKFYTIPLILFWEYKWHESRVSQIRMEVMMRPAEKKS